MKDRYINLILDEYISGENFDAVFGDGWIDQNDLEKLPAIVSDYAFAEYGIDARGIYADKVAEIFESMNGKIIVRHGDEYAGYWYKLRPSYKTKFFDERRSSNPVVSLIGQLGEEALRRALNKIVEEDGLRSMEEKWEAVEGEFLDSDGDASDENPGLNSRFFASEPQKIRFIKEADDQLQAVEDADLTNSEKSQARGYLLAVKALADTPEPPADLIWTIINRAASIAGLAGFFLTLIALIATAG
jgi:hypothetical protein